MEHQYVPIRMPTIRKTDYTKDWQSCGVNATPIPAHEEYEMV